MNPPNLKTSSRLITMFAAVMLVLQLLLAVQAMLITNVRSFALQSLLLAAIAAVVGYVFHAWHAYIIALLTMENGVLRRFTNTLDSSDGLRLRHSRFDVFANPAP